MLIKCRYVGICFVYVLYFILVWGNYREKTQKILTNDTEMLMSIDTQGEKNMQKGEKAPSQRNSIKIIKQFSDFYTMGSKVMPSTHSGQEVLFAKRRLDGMEVVIKTIEKACSFSSKHQEEQWRGSTEMLMNLPATNNIVRIHEVLEDALMYYVVMEKVEGMDLFELLRNKGGLPIDEAKAILRQLLQAVQDLHSRGCIHKDLKLENVMVDSPKSASGPTVVKLIDLDTSALPSAPWMKKSP